MPTATTEQLNAYKFTSVITLLLSIYGSLTYTGIPEGHISFTPYTSSDFLLFIYWGVLYLWQIVYIVQIFFPDEYRISIISVVGWHFPIFNVLTYIWAEFFSSGHFFLSEITLILNFFNILVLYFAHKTFSLRPLGNWLLIHVPIVALPMAWLLNAIFWNGAVWLHIHKTWGRILANVFIWNFLLVPGFFLLVFNDWATGLGFSYLLFALAIGQLENKVFALQWIFAFTIAGTLLVWSVVAAIVGGIRLTAGENAPLLVVEEEQTA